MLGMLLILSACDLLFPSNDDEAPNVMINSPTSYFSWVTTEATLDISGTATDNHDLKSVKIKVNDSSPVTADNTPAWSMMDIPLAMGENTIVVTAEDKAGNKTTATLYVTRNTDTEFSGIPYFSQGNVFATQPIYITVRQAISASAKAITSVKLVRLNPDFTVDEEIGELYDNGDLGNSDEILGDGVYSGYLPIQEETAGQSLYRVAVNTDAKVANYSPLFKVNVYDDITDEEASSFLDNNANLSTVLNATSATGLEEGANELAAWYENQPYVESAEMVDGHLEVTYTSGIKGGVIFSETDENGKITTLGSGAIPDRRAKPDIPLKLQTRGVNSLASLQSFPGHNQAKEEDPDAVQDKDVLIWQPYANALAYTYQPELNAVFDESDLGLNVVNMSNEQCDIASLSSLTEYGTVILMTHGLEGEKIFTHELMTEENTWDYMLQMLNGEITFFENLTYDNVGGYAQTGTVYVVQSAFIRNLPGTFPNSIIYNGSCQSSMSANLSNAFTAKGAGAYLAFSKTVSAGFAKSKCLEYFTSMAVDLDDNGDAFIPGQTDPGYVDHATFTMSGNDDLHYSYDLINGDFEFGNVNGWTRFGDGRVITQLASQQPTGGNFMGIISTGLGYTEASGSIAQSFLVPESVDNLYINWNFISEEFMEYVGSQFQDYLEFVVVDEDGIENILFSETIDSFVSYGLTQSSDIVFDQGDTYMTGWREFEADISAYHGQVVRLIIRIGDVGDSIYDSACLLDDISIE
jgi:hypothetical protein